MQRPEQPALDERLLAPAQRRRPRRRAKPITAEEREQPYTDDPRLLELERKAAE